VYDATSGAFVQFWPDVVIDATTNDVLDLVGIEPRSFG